MSIDGLASGLDTSSLISSLMQIERQPQVRLRTERSELVRMNSYYQEINRNLGAIGTAAEAITGPDGWNAAKATSSDTGRVTVTASDGAATGNLRFTVDQLAAAGSVVSSGSVTAKDTVIVDPATTPKLYLTKGDGNTEIDVGDGALSTIVANINKSDAGVSAAAVNVGDTDGDGTNEFRLQLTSTTTGARSDITVTDAPDGGGTDPFAAQIGTMDTLVQGADAVLRVGGNGDGTGGYTIQRASNTFSDVLDGVTFTLTEADEATAVTVGVSQNTEAIADRVAKLVDTVNTAVSGMAAQQSFDASSKSGGPLMGDSFVRRLRTSLVRAGSDSVAGNPLGSPSGAGIEAERDGTLSFDRDVFLEAYEADPASVQSLLGADTGVAGRLGALADASEDQVESSVKAREGRLPDIDNRIAGWDRRLEVREQTLRKQFQAMEVALNELNSQSSWLAGQINSLNVNSGGT